MDKEATLLTLHLRFTMLLLKMSTKTVYSAVPCSFCTTQRYQPSLFALVNVIVCVSVVPDVGSTSVCRLSLIYQVKFGAGMAR